jgi:hypothetical protein
MSGGSEQIEQMHCIEVVEIVTDYFERALSETERIRLESHVEICEGCEAYLEQMRRTIAALRGLDAPTRPPDLDTLLAAFRARHAG